MNSTLTVIAAGSAFAMTVILALVVGALIDARAHTHYWVLLLFFAGIVLGAYTAWRMIARAIRG